MHSMLFPALMLVWRKISPRTQTSASLLLIATALGPFVYNAVPYRLWRDVLDQWPGYPEQGEPIL